MKPFSVAFLVLLLGVTAVQVRAQAVYAATAHQVSITAGGMASIFQPDFQGEWSPKTGYPLPQATNYPLVGMGAFVDVKFTRWIQLEAEGRWLRYNQFNNIHQDNYLIGPRVPIHRFWKANLYAKALIGYSNMTFDTTGGSGRFSEVAFGGGMDIKVTKRLSFRAADVEYQYWPHWGNTTLSPYGASMGIGYRVF